MGKPLIPNQTWGGIVSLDPLVTISKRADFFDQPMGFAPLIPQLRELEPSVHFIGLCDTLEKPDLADSAARDYEAQAKVSGHALFVFIVSTEIESYQLSLRGIPNILANELMFVDDTKFTIVRDGSEPAFDAVYNAQFYPFKRHVLAEKVEKLLLIYKMPAEQQLEALRLRFPTATFANNTGGKYRRFTPEELSVWYGRSATGLCLSASEGAMRVSVEYQLCGLPVITTPSIGGRDRYFIDDHVRLCRADPNAIADAVSEMKARAFSPEVIRSRILRLLSFDRVNFLRAANKLIAGHCRRRQVLKNFRAFRGMPIQPHSLTAVMSRLSGAGTSAGKAVHGP